MRRFLVLTLCLFFVGALAVAMLELAPPAIDLRIPVHGQLAQTGVSHPVTAVLLNYRGYDTLLEIAVLLLALLAVVTVTDDAGVTAPHAEHPVLQTLARVAAPLMIVVAVYLLWAGAFRPGGAFQAGAVLAAAAVLLHLVGLLPRWRSPRLPLRIGIVAGFVVFLTVATALLARGALLTYPPATAGILTLLIECALTLSLALILAGLFLILSRDEQAP